MCNSGRGRHVALFAILAVAGASVLAAQAPVGPALPDLPVRSLEQLVGAARPGVQPLSRPRTVAAGLDDPRTLSLSLTQPTPLRTVLQLLFRGTAVSAIVPDSLTGTFSGELHKVTLRQALDAILAHAGSGYLVRGTVIHVFPRVHAQEGRR